MTCRTSIASKMRFASTWVALLAAGCATADPPVVDAAVRGDANGVAAALAKGGRADEPGERGRTALMWASGASTTAVSIDANGRMRSRQEPGHPNLEIMKLLLKGGASPNTVDSTGHSALVHAATAGDAAAVALLLGSGADPKVGAEQRVSALGFAASGGHEKVVEELLAAHADANAQCEAGQTPLMTAAFGGYVPIVQQLLRAGARIDAVDDEGNTALSNAAYAGQVAAVRALINAKASVNLRSSRGETALKVAIHRKHSDVAEVLRAAGGTE